MRHLLCTFVFALVIAGCKQTEPEKLVAPETSISTPFDSVRFNQLLHFIQTNGKLCQNEESFYYEYYCKDGEDTHWFIASRPHTDEPDSTEPIDGISVYVNEATSANYSEYFIYPEEVYADSTNLHALGRIMTKMLAQH